ncbi:MAG TPA: hypothetical protein VLM37_12555, partial [Fibrobacteraceae bacterium]|nr:hypothetical protein [Fibrobacteraceae bacterium]
MESAPKTALTAIHHRIVGKKGLLSGARVIQDLLTRLLEPRRLEEQISQWEPWQWECIQWIYLARSRGLEYAEILVSVP